MRRRRPLATVAHCISLMIVLGNPKGTDLISGLMALEPGSFVHARVGTYRNLTFENPSARLGR